jgi:ribosome-binding factor A
VARRRTAARPYARTDRISEAIRAIVATELERLSDEELEMVTITGVTVSKDLDIAEVFYSAMTAEAEGRGHAVSDALEVTRPRIQQVVNRQISARRTPQIVFRPDEVLSAALRIEDIIEGRVEVSDDDR